MPDTLKTELVEDAQDDFTQMPESKASKHKMVVLGDLHANALKLLHFLVKQNVVEITKEDYDKFVILYFSIPQEIQGMRNLINERVTVKDKTPFLRFLGDELADRGQNDFYILMLFKKLDDAHVQFDINQSNHTVEFCMAYETTQSQKPNTYTSDFLDEKQTRSIYNLSDALKNETIKNQELNDLIDIHKKHQKLISYSLSDDSKNVTLYSHAPVDYTLIHSLAIKLKTPYLDHTPKALAASIELINKAYVKHVQSNTLHLLVNTDMMKKISKKKFNYEQMLKDHPLELLLWSRNYKDIDRKKRPINWDEKQFTLSYMHGHDSKCKKYPPM